MTPTVKLKERQEKLMIIAEERPEFAGLALAILLEFDKRNQLIDDVLDALLCDVSEPRVHPQRLQHLDRGAEGIQWARKGIYRENRWHTQGI